MKLQDYKDANGISLQTYVDSLIEKIASITTLTGFLVIVDLEQAKKTNAGIHLVSCLGEGADKSIPIILRELATHMEAKVALEGYTPLHEGEN